MFKDGLHDKVDIYFLKRNFSNRTDKDKITLANISDLVNVPCRIMNNQKILFSGKLKLEAGLEIIDNATGMVYETTEASKIVRSIVVVHHTSVKIRIKSESGKYVG